MGRRQNLLMEETIKVAMNRLTPRDHTTCIQILMAAQIPVHTISRLIFLPNQLRVKGRRYDHVTEAIIDRARSILQCSNERDARAYLLLHEMTPEVIERALCGEFHRSR